MADYAHPVDSQKRRPSVLGVIRSLFQLLKSVFQKEDPHLGQKIASHLLRRQVRSNLLSKMGVFFLKYTFKKLKKTLDYAEYGGAPLLGVNGVSIICHGSSSPKAIKNGIRVAANMVRQKVDHKNQEMLSFHRVGSGART